MSILRIIRATTFLALAGGGLAACVAPSQSAPAQRPVAVTYRPIAAPAPSVERQFAAVADPGFNRPPAALTERIDQLWASFPGKTGIAVRRIDGDWSYAKRGDEYFPQQSVSKLWVTMTVLDAIDNGRLSLSTPVDIGPENLTVFHQPIAARVAREGVVRETVGSLIEQAITHSDNTANDSLLRTAGGPDVVRGFIAKNGLGPIRFGPGERLLQAGIAGMNWSQAYSKDRTFYVERAKVPEFIRKKALESYVADPVDGAQPSAVVAALAKLARGELLSAQSTKLLTETLSRTHSGPQRLKGGVPAGWQIGHKTGTGQEFGGTSTGYNDIGILTAPDGTRYAIAVMLAETTASIPERMRLMQNVVRAVVDTHGR
ncbi:serine hydrolase [Sphingorhabdus soli]|uniref:beta-lactamase n=1 Tax=Flavisphingopyxis soli TaxID=2601267 RepID=A0A5C6ULE0_9SPHN|nr:serine hydrolase [Sphingorhabdus soli]TXC73659.1 serine hydrolase [Sphingorhabdus soli]